MSYIPKSAQRKIDRYNRKRAEIVLSPKAQAKLEQALAPPMQLRSGQPGSRMWDVYFNGEKQNVCTFADRMLGRITRYKYSRGSTGIGHETENLIGNVEFVKRGERPVGLPSPANPITPTQAKVEVQEFLKNNPAPKGARIVMGGRRSGVMIAAVAALVAAGVQVEHGKD